MLKVFFLKLHLSLKFFSQCHYQNPCGTYSSYISLKNSSLSNSKQQFYLSKTFTKWRRIVILPLFTLTATTTSIFLDYYYKYCYDTSIIPSFLLWLLHQVVGLFAPATLYVIEEVSAAAAAAYALGRHSKRQDYLCDF